MNSDDHDKVPPAEEAIWVSSDLTPEGTYVLSVQFSDDVALPLNVKQAQAYAAEVHRASAIAQYDAAILRQLTEKLGAPPREAAFAVATVRADRPPLDATALGPLSLTPSVSAISGKPYLACAVATPHERDGQRCWQWSIAEARQHAQQVLECSSVIDLDSAYRRWLIGQCGIDEGRAMQVVEDLGNFFVLIHG